MPDTISPPNPGVIDLRSNDVWQYPLGADIDPDNPAAEAREEYRQQQYAEQLAAPDPESFAIESGQPLRPIREGAAVNQFETVPGQNEAVTYTTNQGVVINPQHAEAVLAEAASAVDNAYGATPEMLAAAAARQSREQLAAAVAQAGVYAPRVEAMRDRALIDWGMPGDNSLN